MEVIPFAGPITLHRDAPARPEATAGLSVDSRYTGIGEFLAHELNTHFRWSGAGSGGWNRWVCVCACAWMLSKKCCKKCYSKGDRIGRASILRNKRDDDGDDSDCDGDLQGSRKTKE